LFSALAIARVQHLLHVLRDALLGEGELVDADDAFLPRMVAATRSSLRGLTRTVRSTALASLSASRRGVRWLAHRIIFETFLSRRGT